MWISPLEVVLTSPTTMHLIELTSIALAVVVAANASDVEPCAQISKLVADANQDQSAFQSRPLLH